MATEHTENGEAKSSESTVNIAIDTFSRSTSIIGNETHHDSVEMHHRQSKESRIEEIQLVAQVLEGMRKARRERKAGERKDFHQKLYKTPKEVVEAIIIAAEKKTHLTFDKTVVLGFMAGVYVAFGGFLALSVSQAMPNADSGVKKLLIGTLFPFALLLIIFLGGELFTGNTMYLTVGLLAKRVRFSRAILNLITVYFTNWLGCVAAGYFFGYLTELYSDEPYHSGLISLATHKVELSPGVAFLRGIPANWLVCAAIFFNQTAEDVGGKIAGMIIAVAGFAVVGFEHAIANMFYVDLALMYGAEFGFGEFIYKNLILVTLGNIVGGAFFVGTTAYYVYMTGQPPAETKEEQMKKLKEHHEKLFTFTWV